jgi:hypothetical protein
MSVRWMRTATIGKGGFMEAMAWAKEAAGYVEKLTGHKVDVWFDSFGAVGVVRWTIDAPDLGAIEKAQAAVMMDQPYWQMIQKAANADLFIVGSSVDYISRKI